MILVTVLKFGVKSERLNYEYNLFLTMSLFPYDSLPTPKNDCFFTQLLRECSVEVPPEQEYFLEDPISEEELRQCSARATEQQNRVMEDFDLWRGLEDNEEDITSHPEPHLTRATSLRQEQERKIAKFLNVFTKKEMDKECLDIKTFSPLKRKKIIKGKK